MKKNIFYGNILSGDKMKQGYLIAIDLDGTLIQGFDDYDKLSFELLKKLAKDNFIVIATGRPLRSSKYYYDILELNTPIINYNGALVHHPKDSNFKKSMITVNKDDVIKIFNDNKNIIDNIFCEVEDDIFLYKKQDEINSYLHLDGGVLHTGEFENILKENPNGAIVFSKIGSEQKLEKYLINEYQDNLRIRFWDDKKYVVSEIYNPKTSKANGLKRIIEYYNIPYEKTISIGDGHNDIEMFNITKYSVAMGNSHPLLIEHATHKTKSVQENGVYHFLKDFFEIK